MRNSKLLKSILISTLGISAIGSIAAISTSCSCGSVNVTSVSSVSLNKSETTLDISATETLIATVLPETATDKSITWTSSNPSVATVHEYVSFFGRYGVITAVSAGTTTITVTSVDNPSAKATCEVTVNSIHVTSVTLNKTSTTLALGETEALTATVLPEDATDQSVTWSSSDVNVATVDSNGTITAVAAGTATITVKTNDGGKTATCEVTVVDTCIVITANEDSTLTFRHDYFGNFPDLQYSIDGGTNWSPYSTTININQGEELYLKGNNPAGWSSSASVYSTLSITGDVSISGSVMALLDNGAAPGEQGDITTNIPCDYCFYGLFKNSTGITSVSDDFLPATSLAKGCYRKMFEGCTSLTTAPILPATTLTEACYSYMFENCTSLTTAPDLPATTLAISCYDSMFEDCSSLTAAPDLPATTLANWCYYGMFWECSSLITVPNLPATNLANGCYRVMFQGCSSLNSIKIGYTGDYDNNFNDWVKGVANSGTFYYNGIQTAQDFQLPSGWIVYYNGEFTRILANMNSTLTLNNSGFNNPDLQYSTDGTDWFEYSAPINIPQGQSLYLKGNNHNGWSHGNLIYSTLSITGDVSIYGNVMALLDNGAKPGEWGNITDIPCSNCFNKLFTGSTGITSISDNFLPATNLAIYCYDSMFEDCSSLTAAPDLPATTLAEGCYFNMFYDCSSLTAAPDLPATTLAGWCYTFMFQGCSSLTTAPDLPATRLAQTCYSYMFDGCSSLTTAPELPATTLTEGCYNCMFENCASLNSIKIGYTGDYDNNFSNWVEDVASSGIFYYNGSDTCANFGFPSGWHKQPF